MSMKLIMLKGTDLADGLRAHVISQDESSGKTVCGRKYRRNAKRVPIGSDVAMCQQCLNACRKIMRTPPAKRHPKAKAIPNNPTYYKEWTGVRQKASLDGQLSFLYDDTEDEGTSDD